MKILVGIVVWAVAFRALAWALDIELTWRVCVLMLGGNVLGNVIDAIVVHR